MGDFNIAPEDRDAARPQAAWEGSVHVSPEERQALKALLDLGLNDTFRLFEQPDASSAGGTTVAVRFDAMQDCA